MWVLIGYLFLVTCALAFFFGATRSSREREEKIEKDLQAYKLGGSSYPLDEK